MLLADQRDVSHTLRIVYAIKPLINPSFWTKRRHQGSCQQTSALGCMSKRGSDVKSIFLSSLISKPHFICTSKDGAKPLCPVLMAPEAHLRLLPEPPAPRGFGAGSWLQTTLTHGSASGKEYFQNTVSRRIPTYSCCFQSQQAAPHHPH